MRAITTVAVALMLLGCGKKNPVTNPPGGYYELPAPEDTDDRGYTERLMTKHIFGDGFVGSKGKHDGDSALFTGIAMGSVPCEKAAFFLKSFEIMAASNDGGFVRNSPLDEEYILNSNEYSLDQHAGVMFGLQSVMRRCPDIAVRAVELWNYNLAFIDDTGGEYLHPNASLSKINVPTRILMKMVSMSDVSEGELMDLEAWLIGGAMGIKATKKACYPIHLGTIGIVSTVLADRPISKLGMDAFCEQTDGMDLPLTDYLCGRISGKLWLDSYEPNKWEYRHQRCGSWESSPDARDDETHGVDYLIMEALVSKQWRSQL